MGSLWNRSGIVERYADDIRAAGAKAFFFQGGTTTPLTVFRDSGEAGAHPNPVLADSDGRWPDVFIPYITSYDVQVKSAFDVQLTYSTQITNPNPVDVSVVVDPANTVQTGMGHFEFVNAVKTGYVRLNGRSIGNAASSATERANADTSALFTYLWNNIGNTLAPVSGGRGGSAASDFAANKNITLPDCRGAFLVGLDDMGASAGGFFSGLSFITGSAILAASRIGGNGVTMTLANLPAHAHSGTTQTEGAHTHSGTTNTEAAHTHSGNTGTDSTDHTHTFSGTTSGQSQDHTHNYGSTAAGGPSGGGSLITAGAVNTTSGTSQDHNHTYSGITSGINQTHFHAFTTGAGSAHSHTFTTGPGSAHSHTFTTDTQGSGTAFNNLPRSLTVTWFIKL